MHVRAVLLPQLVSEGQQLVHVLVESNYRVLQQLLNVAEVNTLIGVALDDVEADFVESYHGVHEQFVVPLLEEDLNGFHAAFDALPLGCHGRLGEQLLEGELFVVRRCSRSRSFPAAAMEGDPVLGYVWSCVYLLLLAGSLILVTIA